MAFYCHTEDSGFLSGSGTLCIFKVANVSMSNIITEVVFVAKQVQLNSGI
jgi:hypothetical protein